VFTGLLLSEVLVRITSFSEPKADIIPDEVFGKTYIPNLKIVQFGACPKSRETQYLFESNSRGLRDQEYSYKKSDNKRILILGDSFTAGRVAFQNTFPELLEKRLKENDNKWQVINAGHDGWGTDNEFLFFENEGYKYQADLVILAFFLNDVTDLLSNGYFNIDSNDNLIFNGVSSKNYRKDLIEDKNKDSFVDTRPLYKKLLSHLELYRFMGQAVLPDFPKVENFLYKIGLISKVVARARPPLFFDLYADDYDADMVEAWEVTMRLILKIKEKSIAQHSRFGVVFINAPWQVYEDEVKKYNELYPSIRTYFSHNVNKPDEILIKFLREKNIPYLHLLPYFKEYYANTKKRLHFRCDSHWNILGNQLASELIYNWMVENQLLPQVNG
ncbi:MAG: SGNH/GDSL hydrolase family protein, partial [Desulfobacterales bacterium]|nr:SGNH/GDSL hydrolase family protein [Desulfobacterales bacterium]